MKDFEFGQKVFWADTELNGQICSYYSESLAPWSKGPRLCFKIQEGIIVDAGGIVNVLKKTSGIIEMFDRNRIFNTAEEARQETLKKLSGLEPQEITEGEKG